MISVSTLKRQDPRLEEDWSGNDNQQDIICDSSGEQ